MSTRGTIESFNQWKELELKDFVVGLLEYRQSHFEKAVERTQKAVARSQVRTWDAQSYVVMAMANYHLNRIKEAHIALGKACEIVETKLPKLDSGYLGCLWPDVLFTHLLLREAKQLIEGNSATSSRGAPGS